MLVVFDTARSLNPLLDQQILQGVFPLPGARGETTRGRGFPPSRRNNPRSSLSASSRLVLTFIPSINTQLCNDNIIEREASFRLNSQTLYRILNTEGFVMRILISGMFAVLFVTLLSSAQFCVQSEARR